MYNNQYKTGWKNCSQLHQPVFRQMKKLLDTASLCKLSHYKLHTKLMACYYQLQHCYRVYRTTVFPVILPLCYVMPQFLGSFCLCMHWKNM